MKMNGGRNKMEYKKYDYNECKPAGKNNCICWLNNGEKVTAFYHQKNGNFVGMYGQHQNKVLQDVKEWAYAILPKRHSNDLFPNAVSDLCFSDNTFKTEFSKLDNEKQERLFREIEIVRAAILNYFKENS